MGRFNKKVYHFILQVLSYDKDISSFIESDPSASFFAL